MRQPLGQAGIWVHANETPPPDERQACRLSPASRLLSSESSHGGDELVGKWIGPRSHAVPASIQTARLRSGHPPRSNTTRAPATPKRSVIEPQAR